MHFDYWPNWWVSVESSHAALLHINFVGMRHSQIKCEYVDYSSYFFLCLLSYGSGVKFVHHEPCCGWLGRRCFRHARQCCLRPDRYVIDIIAILIYSALFLDGCFIRTKYQAQAQAQAQSSQSSVKLSLLVILLRRWDEKPAPHWSAGLSSADVACVQLDCK